MINVLSNVRELLGKVGSTATLPGSTSKVSLARWESLVQNNSLLSIFSYGFIKSKLNKDKLIAKHIESAQKVKYYYIANEWYLVLQFLLYEYYCFTNEATT